MNAHCIHPQSSVQLFKRYHVFKFYRRRGNEFLKPLIILDQSILRGADNLNKISEYVAKGDNIVILSNHQTEADPQVILSCNITQIALKSYANKRIFSAAHGSVLHSPIMS